MQEISISLEETNRLRESIGLPPIPQSENQDDNHNNNNTKAEDNKSNVTSKQELSIDETNKLRVSLGLQPLEVNRNSDAVENYNAHKQEAEKTKRDEQLRERLETAKLNSAKKRKLKGRTLLDDYEEMDNDKWLNNLDVKPAAPKTKTGKSEKNHNDSNSNHVDISVSHNINDLRLVKDNDVFTLKDSGINDDEPDEIFNQDLANKSKVEKHLEEMDKVRQIKNGIGYKSINDDNDDDNDNDDNDINKTEKVSIKNSNISLNDKAVKSQSESLSGPKAVDLNLFELDEISAPKKPLTKMKKIKSKKDKDKSKRKTFDENDDINLKSVKLENMDDDIADDTDELEQALDLKRKLKQRSRTTMTAEDKAREIRNLTRSNAENDLETEAMKSTIVFDPTVDFINSLNTKPEAGVKEQSKDLQTKIDDNETNSNTEVEKPKEESKQEIEPQPKYGVGKLLKQLRDDGLESSSDKTQRESIKTSELVKLKISIEERILKEQLNSDSQYMKLPEAEQEKIFQNKLDDILIEKEIVPNYENYNPKVHLTYRNDTGNELNTKQAFKFMSNKFHGTKSRDKKTKKEWLRKPKK